MDDSHKNFVSTEQCVNAMLQTAHVHVNYNDVYNSYVLTLLFLDFYSNMFSNMFSNIYVGAIVHFGTHIYVGAIVHFGSSHKGGASIRSVRGSLWLPLLLQD